MTPDEALKAMSKCPYWSGRKRLSNDTPFWTRVREEIAESVYIYFTQLRWIWRIARRVALALRQGEPRG